MEEYFVTSIYAQLLFYTGIPIIGVEVCEDDSNKGPDAIIKIMDSNAKTIQVTRFTLTEYLNKRKVAEKKVENLILEILKLIKVEIPINVKINMYKIASIPDNNQKTEKALAKVIADAIKLNKAALLASNSFINCVVSDERVKKITPLITLQSIPKDFNSNFFGRDNVFIDYDFDNVSFSQEDISKESLNIYQKKNGGKAEILLIWADTFEVLYNPIAIAKSLKQQFRDASFKEVHLFSFYNRIDLYLSNQVQNVRVK